MPYGREAYGKRAEMAVNPLADVWGSKTINAKTKSRRRAHLRMERTSRGKASLRSRADTAETLGQTLWGGIHEMNKKKQEYLRGYAEIDRKTPTASTRALSQKAGDRGSITRSFKGTSRSDDQSAGDKIKIVRPEEQYIRPVANADPRKVTRTTPGSDFDRRATHLWDAKSNRQWSAIHRGIEQRRDPNFRTQYLVSDRPEHRAMARGLAGKHVRSITQGYVPWERRRWITDPRQLANRGRAQNWRRFGVY